MINFYAKDIKSCFHEMIDGLAYQYNQDVGKWGICYGYIQPLCIEIDDVTNDCDMTLSFAGFTKSRWTKLLKSYIRPDFQEWVHKTCKRLEKYPNRPFISEYQPSPNTSRKNETLHAYGNCLVSIQIRLWPQPTVMLYSRASALDKTGLCDLALIHVISRELKSVMVNKPDTIRGQWTIGLAYISAVAQTFYVTRFNKPLKNHRLRIPIERFLSQADDMSQVKYGPVRRNLTRVNAWLKDGFIHLDKAFKDLTINPEVWS